MQVFVNNCIFGILNVKRKEMHDNKQTMVDLWRKAGIPSVAVEIGSRQLRWLGHLARMPDTRLEKQSLWLWLYTSDNPHSGRRRTAQGTLDTNRALWARLQDLRKTLAIEETGWSRDWITRATANHGLQWRKGIRKWQEAKTTKEDEDLWHIRHAPGGKAEQKAAARAQRAAATADYRRNDQGLILCLHCDEPFAANRIWQHTHSCAVLPPERKLLAKANRERRQRRLQAQRAPLAEQLHHQPPGSPQPASRIHIHHNHRHHHLNDGSVANNHSLTNQHGQGHHHSTLHPQCPPHHQQLIHFADQQQQSQPHHDRKQQPKQTPSHATT